MVLWEKGVLVFKRASKTPEGGTDPPSLIAFRGGAKKRLLVNTHNEKGPSIVSAHAVRRERCGKNANPLSRPIHGADKSKSPTIRASLAPNLPMRAQRESGWRSRSIPSTLDGSRAVVVAGAQAYSKINAACELFGFGGGERT